MFSKNLIKTAFVAALLSVSSAHAEKPNFDYSSLRLSLGTVNYKTPLCVAGSCASSGNTAGVGGTLQIGDNFLIDLDGSSLKVNSGDWSADGSGGEFGIGLAFPMSNAIDFRGGISSISSDINACGFGVCVKHSDTGNSVSAGIRAWLNDAHTFSGAIDIRSSKLSEDIGRTTTTGILLAYWVQTHHKLSVSYGSNDKTTGTSVGYAYVF